MPVSSDAVTASKPLHERLQDLHYKAGLTQAELAQACSRSQPRISEMMRGTVKAARPSADVMDGVRKLEEQYRDLLEAA